MASLKALLGITTRRERDDKDAYIEELQTLKHEVVTYGEESVLTHKRLRRNVSLLLSDTDVNRVAENLEIIRNQ